jgi:hypothetical protein
MGESIDDRDGELVAAMASGDEDAFVALYRRYMPILVRWCLREAGNRELAAVSAARSLRGCSALLATSSPRVVAAAASRNRRAAVSEWHLGH